MVAPRDRSNLSAAADLLGPLKTASAISAPAPDVSGTEREKPRGLVPADSHLVGLKPSGAAVKAGGERGGASEQERQKEFDEWCAKLQEAHERSKADIKKRAQAATNDDAQKQLKEQNGEQIRKIRLELDKLNLEKSNIESRSPMPAGGDQSEEDELEKTRSEMTIQMERTKLEQELRVAELEEKAKLVEEEKTTVDAAVAEADADLKKQLDVLQSEHTAVVEQAKTAYERQRNKIMIAAEDYGQLAQQQESTLLLKETERYTSELQKAMREARSVAEAEIEEKLCSAKAQQDEEADSKIKSERKRLDAAREEAVSEVNAEMETIRTEKLRRVTSDFSSADSSRAAATTAMENARAQIACRAEKEVSTVEERLDMARKEVRQGLPAAELQLKTQLASELDEMETDFKKQLDSERASISTEDGAESAVTELPALKESELREWQTDHEKASQQGIAGEVAELQQRVRADLQAKELDLETETARIVDTRRSELLTALQSQEKSIADTYRKKVDDAKGVAERANANAIERLRMQLQSESSQRAIDLRTRLTAEQAMTGAAFEEQRARATQQLAISRTERESKLAHIGVELAATKLSADAQRDDLIAARLAHCALQVGVQATAATPQHASDMTSTDLSTAQANLSQVKVASQDELDRKVNSYRLEEDALKMQLAEMEKEQSTGGAIAGLADGFAEQELAIRKQEFEAKTAVEMNSVRVEVQQERLRAKGAASHELAQLEQRLQTASRVRIENPSPDGAGSHVADQLAATRAEEESLKQVIEWANAELGREQALVTQLQTKQSGPTPFGKNESNRQVPPTTRIRKQATATWAEPVAREVRQTSEGGSRISRLALERQKLERARTAATKATRAIRDKQAQWATRRDEWLADMRAAKKAGDPGATECVCTTQRFARRCADVS